MSGLNQLELLMPAGSMEKLRFAYTYGADAAYAGVPLFSLRARENEFSLDEMGQAYAIARSSGKKLYLTANVFARNVKIKPFTEQIDKWMAHKPDALIMSDPGLMAIVKEKYPEQELHLSVQANCMNWRAVKFWHESLGVSRVILSRELRLEEIREIKQRVPDVELEAFVHGSICIAYSGRCLLSHYMSYRDANQGVCDNSCRYPYKVYKAESEKDEEYFIEDLRDQGKFYEISEDEHGTYIMNAKDLRLIEHLKEMADAGVCSFKVEGRTKSVYYVAMVTRAYRQALNDLQSGRGFNPSLLGDLEKVANRGYDKAFMLGGMSHNSQNYEDGGTRSQTQKFAGIVTGRDDEGHLKIEVRGTVGAGQECEVLSPNESLRFKIGRIWDAKGNLVDKAHSGAGVYTFESNVNAPPDSLVSLIQQ